MITETEAASTHKLAAVSVHVVKALGVMPASFLFDIGE
jgi:hypothetical protein